MSLEVFEGPPLVAGNWKMNGTRESCRVLAQGVAEKLGSLEGADVALFPPYPFLGDAAEAIRGSGLSLGAQDLHPAEKGAFTGAVSGLMLLSIGCRYVLVGHSERRAVFGDTDEVVAEKLLRAVESGLEPILCVGESLGERKEHRGKDVVLRQLAIGLRGYEKPSSKITVAYEPVWAIGTGQAATPEAAAEMQGRVRTFLLERFGGEAGRGIRILYGGSVTPENAGDLLAKEEVGGVLVGGASLNVESFSAIVRAAAEASPR